MKITMDYDYIIIGGGICGVQIAALCSTIGKVLLLEKTKMLGGRARVVEKNGFKLDYGPHPVRFGKKSALANTLRDVGSKDVKFIDPGKMFVYLKNGERHIFPSGIMGYIKTKLIPRIKTIKTIWKLRKKVKKDPNKLFDVSFKEYFEQNDIDPRIRLFLKLASSSMQVNPHMDRSSIGEFYLNFIEVIKKRISVNYPQGGWSTFFTKLSEVIEANSGIIQTESEVEKIIVDNGIATGVIVNGEQMKAKNIVSTIPVQRLFEILDPELAPSDFVEKCKNLRPTAGIVIDFCLSKKITDDNFMFFEEPPSFGIVPSNLTPEIAPENKSIMSFFAPTDPFIIKDKEKRQHYHDKFRAQILEIYPEIEKNIEFERKLFIKMVDGVEIAVDQYRGLRPMIGNIQIPHLHLTGDSIGGTGAGGDVGHTSVRECFDLIKKI
ncbi:MAG: NAD(P)/FAD-dependent oxidoreductase [Promethearchaeota archaeon]|nr:MAG: NAD(P)/FAD-dependent oxidoreductase [Candidatus Lokiarchaeota archaeon]